MADLNFERMCENSQVVESLKHILDDFITAFQFLTRFHFIKQTQWSKESFGRSVKFFPLVGGIIGLLFASIIYGLQIYGAGKISLHFMAISLIVLEIFVTGGLHYDGLMDTMDGIFSGRSRERMLEIMKDSQVGSFGVMSFCVVILLKYSLLMDMAPEVLPVACLTSLIIARMALVMGIFLFPYARAEGLGKIFKQYAESYALYTAGLITLTMMIFMGEKAMIGGIAGLSFALVFAGYVSKRLGGLTGDVYGAIAELTQAFVLVTFAFM